MYFCKHCGKEFESKYKLGGHSTRCKLNPNYEKNQKQIEYARQHINPNNIFIQEKCICQYCGKIMGNKGALSNHEKACDLNPNKEKCPNRKGNGGHTKGYSCKWKGETQFTNEIIRKRTETFINNFKNNKEQYTKFSHKHTEETKEKLRNIFIEKITQLKGPFKCFYNKNACKYIDKLNEDKGWNLQHAENGGEYKILGYFLDGYDKEKNIAFEYDECKHYKDVYNNILNEKDIQRQENIINELNCEFWRYNEKLNLLYCINKI